VSIGATTETATAVLCSSCGGRLARDNTGTVCSPCKRTDIERSARNGALIARNSAGLRAAFDSRGFDGVVAHLRCTPDVALDALLISGIVPFVSARRRAVLRNLVALGGHSHVAAGEALHISRWTVASYRRQLRIHRVGFAEVDDT
jgi:hypothetical protein